MSILTRLGATTIAACASTAAAAAVVLVATVPAAAYDLDSDDDLVRAAEQYIDDVAVHLAEPGVWVDPDVGMSPAEVHELDAAAEAAPVDMRIAVIPAAKIDTAGEYYSGSSLAWEGEEIASQLYDRVGVDGVYAVLTSADSSSDGRGLHAVQHAEEGPTYFVEDAIDDAVECCAPDYGPMLEAFIDRASDVDKPFLVDVAPFAGAGAAGFGLWWGGTALSARRKRRAEDRAHIAQVRPLLDEEVIELSGKVAALPTTADLEQARLSKEVLDTVEKARHRLDALTEDTDVQAVTTLLGSARYSLACLEALQQGRPAPERTAPCFFDPRHGPSTDERDWTPDEGAARTVPVCADCAGRLDTAQQPEPRMVGGRTYWNAGEAVVAYIEGYWTDATPFPAPSYQASRRSLWERRAARSPRRRFRVMAESLERDLTDAGRDFSSSGGGSGGGRSRSGFSSRRRSSGGGSSRRSSRRSGGSRGF